MVVPHGSIRRRDLNVLSSSASEQMLRCLRCAITETPEPERVQVMAAAATRHQIGDDLANGRCDPKSVTAHSCSDHQSGYLIDRVNDWERVRRAVNCSSPRHRDTATKVREVPRKGLECGSHIGVASDIFEPPVLPARRQCADKFAGTYPEILSILPVHREGLGELAR